MLSGQTPTELSVLTDTSHFKFGDIITAHLEVAPASPEMQINNLSELLDSLNSKDVEGSGLGDLEIIDQGPWSFESGILKSDLQIGAYDTGHQFYIYPIEITQGGVTDTIISMPAYFYIAPVAIDSTGLAPIKDILEEPINFQDILPYIIGILALILVVFGIVFFIKKKSRKNQVSTVPKVIIPPYELAIRKLEELENEKLWQQGNIKEYQSRLTFILREYIEKALSIRALEQTTSETIASLRSMYMEEGRLQDLSNMFNIADLVKFAKGEPAVNIHVEVMEKAKEFVYYINQKQQQIAESEEE